MTPTDSPKLAVFVRRYWRDFWTAVPYLYVDSLDLRANPQIDQAILSWRYGEALQPGTVAYDLFNRQTNSRWYVRIDMPGTDPAATPILSWYGVWESSLDLRDGTPIEAGGARIPTGRQSVTVLGLIWLLSKDALSESVYLSSAGVETRINRCLEFNEPHTRKGPSGFLDPNLNLGRNRSPGLGPSQVYAFASNLDDAVPWSTRDILDYLFAYHLPTDVDGDENLGWGLEPMHRTLAPSFDKPHVRWQGISFKGVLDELLSRKRLAGYAVDVVNNKPLVRIFVHNENPITFADDSILFANTDIWDYDPDVDPQISGPVEIRESDAEVYDEVIVRGQPIVACFTISALDGTLVAHWTTAQQDQYDTAASLAPDYSGLDNANQEARDLMFRMQHELERVYQWFGLSPDWDGKVKDGENGSSPSPYYPDPSDNTKPLPFYLPSWRFMPQIPLRTDCDYTGNKVHAGQVIDNTPGGFSTEFLPLFVAIKMVWKDSSTSYFHLDRGGCGAHIEPHLYDPPGQLFSAHIRPQDEGPGFVLTVANGRPFQIASADFTGNGGDLDEFLVTSCMLNWRDNLLATVAVNCDAFCEGIYPDNPDPTPDQFRTLTIDVGDQGRLVYVAPQTVTAIKDYQLVRSTSGGYVYDDRPKLNLWAKLAYEWFNSQRRGVSLKTRRIVLPVEIGGVGIGAMCTNLGAEGTELNINTVVTGIRYDFAEAIGTDPPPPTTKITTDFAEFDPTAFFR